MHLWIAVSWLVFQGHSQQVTVYDDYQENYTQVSQSDLKAYLNNQRWDNKYLVFHLRQVKASESQTDKMP